MLFYCLRWVSSEQPVPKPCVRISRSVLKNNRKIFSLVDTFLFLKMIFYVLRSAIIQLFREVMKMTFFRQWSRAARIIFRRVILYYEIEQVVARLMLCILWMRQQFESTIFVVETAQITRTLPWWKNSLTFLVNVDISLFIGRGGSVTMYTYSRRVMEKKCKTNNRTKH